MVNIYNPELCFLELFMSTTFVQFCMEVQKHVFVNWGIILKTSSPTKNVKTNSWNEIDGMTMRDRRTFFCFQYVSYLVIGGHQTHLPPMPLYPPQQLLQTETTVVTKKEGSIGKLSENTTHTD